MKIFNLSGKINEMRKIYDMILYQDRLKKKKKGKFNRITFNSIVKNKIYFLISVYKIYWNDFITISFFFLRSKRCPCIYR